MAGTNSGLSQKCLNWGFILGLLMSFICLGAAAFYIFTFLNSTLSQGIYNSSFDTASQLIKMRLGLLSCGAFVGMAFGFLGFALFLVGIDLEMDIQAQQGNFKVQFQKMASGAFVILCATILVGICVTRSLEITYKSQGDFLMNAPAPPAGP